MNTSIDTLRIIALVLVTWQHAASVFGAYVETQWRGISPGGYLAFSHRYFFFG